MREVTHKQNREILLYMNQKKRLYIIWWAVTWPKSLRSVALAGLCYQIAVRVEEAKLQNKTALTFYLFLGTHNTKQLVFHQFFLPRRSVARKNTSTSQQEKVIYIFALLDEKQIKMDIPGNHIYWSASHRSVDEQKNGGDVQRAQLKSSLARGKNDR